MLRFSILFLFLLPMGLSAQFFSGKLIDQYNYPLGDTWITVFSTNKMVSRALTRKDGSFELKSVPMGVYNLMVQSLDATGALYGLSLKPGKGNVLQIDLSKDTLRNYVDTPTVADLPVQVNDINPALIAPADGFDYPFIDSDAYGYHIARDFGEKQHLGEDWNKGVGDADLGLPIYSCATGLVIFAGYGGPYWGNVVRVVHNIGTSDAPVLVETVYAHLQDVWIKNRVMLKRGEGIGTMGNVNGKYKAHLHLEVRTEIGMPLGGGYGTDSRFLDPQNFIDAHRPEMN